MSESNRNTNIFSENKVAVITGASSGIGRAAARRCAGLGMKVALADVDEAELAQALEEVKGLAKEEPYVVAVPTDVSSAASLENLKATVQTTFQTETVHFLMNNAGTGTGGGATAPLNAWEKTIGVNLWGVINGCQAFVPMMIAGGEPGMIVNTGSKQGITCPPGNLAYNVSKAGVKVYTEGLQHELRNTDGANLSAHLLVPGWVNTSIFLKSKRDELGEEFKLEDIPFHEAKPAAGAWMPDQVIDFLFAELEKETFYIMCPDNEVDAQTDNLRMQWTMQDITERRPPLSRWHPEYKDAFSGFLEENKS